AVAMNPNAILAQAQADLARRYFQDAQSRAETLLAARVSAGLRAAALLVAADAASGLNAYSVAVTRSGEVVSNNPSSPDAPRAEMRLGWAQYRQNNPAAARQSWTALANRYPSDWRAPLALALGSEVATQAGDTGEARVLADRVVMRYGTSPYAPAARLRRAIVAMHQHREQDAIRDLDELVKGDGARAVEGRQRLVAALSAPRTETSLEEQAAPVVSVGTDVATSPASTNNGSPAADDPVERFV